MNCLLKVENLKKHFITTGANKFKQSDRIIKAVDGISFSVDYGETLGLVGESGCGKSTTGRLILNLIEPTDGKVFYEGENIFSLNKSKMMKVRRNLQIIFQDTFASLNPRMTAGEIIGEALDVHKIYKNKKERREIIEKAFSDVGLNSEQIRRHPHEFSGGQRQRIGIARAICLKPKLIICDEPVSALDVSIQAQIINMMKQIQEKYNLAYIFISHDLKVVKHISDRVAVMYLGRMVEVAYKNELFQNHLHPYTKALISAIPLVDKEEKKDKIILKGEASLKNVGQGCNFSDRCWLSDSICTKETPKLREIKPGHFVACHRL